MTYTTADWLLALSPVALVLGLMVGRGWNAAKAGFTGLGLALVLAWGRFGAGGDALAWAQVKALLLTADVAPIIWAALLLYYIVERAGALRVIADALARLSADPLIQGLLLAWVFASFLQGVGGFGVPVAIVAPILVGQGVPRTRAAVAPALGHGWAVTYGSLATSFLMLIRVTGMSGAELAPPAALMLGALAYTSGLMVAHVLGGWEGVRRVWPYVAVVGTAMGSAQLALALGGLWSLGAIGGGISGLAASVFWIRRNGAHPHPKGAPTAPNAPSVRLALSGYALLVGLALLLRGIRPVKAFLNAQIAVSVDLPATVTARGWHSAAEIGAGFGILAHPGMIILYSCAITYWLFRRAGLYPRGVERDMLRQASKRAGRAALGVYAMVALAATMGRAGMMATLADGLSHAVPSALYAFVAPVIGALGAFITGSNMNSNAVFGVLQRDTAQFLGLTVPVVLAGQTAAAAVVSVLSPAKVAVGCSTVGADEGAVMRHLLGYGALVVVLVGGMTWLGLWLT